MRLLGLCLLLIAIVGMYATAKRSERSTREDRKKGRVEEIDYCPQIDNEVDVVFAIDASYTMRYGVNVAAKFINTLAEFLVDYRYRFGVFLYNDEESKTSWKIHLKEKFTLDQLDKVAKKLVNVGWEYQYGEDHGLAITTAMKELMANWRPKTLRRIVLLTDGQSGSDNSALKEVAANAICQGFKIIAVGVQTEEFNEKFLSSVLTGDPQNVFYDDDNPERLLHPFCGHPDFQPVVFDEKYWAEGCDFKEGDLGTKPDPVQKNCEGHCRKKPDCTHYAYSNYSGGTCFLKKGKVCLSKAEFKKDEFGDRACGYIPERLNFIM